MNNKRNVYLVLLSFLLLFPVSVNAQDYLNISCINQYYHNWQEGVYDVAISGDYAYLACGDEGLRIVDMGEPGAFIDVAQLIYEDAWRIAVTGNYVYLGCSGGDLYIIDVSNPDSPQEINFLDLNAHIHSILFEGDIAYFATSDGVVVIDVGDPLSTQVLWQSTEIYEAVDIEVHGNFAYVACDYQGLYEYDISDITSPQLLNTYQLTTGEYVTGASISGNYAYLSCGWDGFQVVDLTTMQMVASIDSFQYAFAVEVVDSYVYFTYGDPDCPLAIIDISDPLSPQTTAIYYPPEDIFRFKIIGDIVYVADFEHGLRLVDISDPYEPHEVEVYSRYGKDKDVIISDNYAYVRENYKLKIIDINDLQNPVELGFYETDWGYNDLQIVGNIGFLTRHGYTCLFAVDLSDPSSPGLLCEYTVPDGGDVHYRMVVYGNYGYLMENSGIRILDLSDPSNIQDAGYFDNGYMGNCRIFIHDNYAFIEGSQLPFTVLDLSDPISPSFVCRYNLDQHIRDIKFTDGILYAVTDQKLLVFDATDFYQWAPLAEVRLFDPYVDYMQSLDLNGKFMYVTTVYFGLYVYDITDYTSPHLTGYYRTPGNAWGGDARGHIVAVADEDNLGFYDCSDALVDIENVNPAIPQSFSLLPNYPNPFNASTRIQFEMPKRGHVTVTVFDALGRNVTTLANRAFEAGTNSLIWDGTGRDGQTVASGRYYIQARTGDATEKMPITLLK